MSPTGIQAAGGIGKETTFAFAEAGVKGVLCADIKGDETNKVAQESKGLTASPEFKAVGFAVDITDARSVQSLVEFALKEFRRIGYLVNAADVSAQTRERMTLR